MYKLFLTFRYLTRKAIVIFPIMVVWLCVMMLIIVTSIMGGFVERVEQANRDLLGDIVIDAEVTSGWPYYEELQQELAALTYPPAYPDGAKHPLAGQKVVVASTPLVRGYGLINLPDHRYNHFAQVIGIDPAGRAQVSSFRETLFRQYASPLQAAEDLTPYLPADARALQQKARDSMDEAWRRWEALDVAKPPGGLSHAQWLVRGGVVGGAIIVAAVLVVLATQRRGWRAVTILWIVATAVTGPAVVWDTYQRLDPSVQSDRWSDLREQMRSEVLRAERTTGFALQLPPGRTFTKRQELVDLLVPRAPTFAPPAQVEKYWAEKGDPPDGGCIVGVEIGMFPRDRRGNFLRRPELDFTRAVLTLVPVSARATISQPRTGTFLIVDDSYSRVYDVDSTYVYAPFKIIQEMNGMNGGTFDGKVYHARCSELDIKVTHNEDPAQVREASDLIRTALDRFADTRRDLGNLQPRVQTWEQKQASYIDAVRNEKRLITFILLVESLVVLVVIFLIFYMIVRNKTKDIGIIKALGGSEVGVGMIFTLYGLFIGVVGGILGMVGGVVFIWHTNEIHEWIYRLTGFMLWNRRVYLFDRIPDTVNPREVALYVALAAVAGLVGALIPAVLAGLQNPVKAVRYE